MDELNQQAQLWNMIVRPIEAPKESAGGILLAAAADANEVKCNVGRIVSMGPLCFRGERFAALEAPPVAVGDFVTYNAYSGIPIEERDPVTGEKTKYRILHDDNVLTRVEDPERIVGYIR